MFQRLQLAEYPKIKITFFALSYLYILKGLVQNNPLNHKTRSFIKKNFFFQYRVLVSARRARTYQQLRHTKMKN